MRKEKTMPEKFNWKPLADDISKADRILILPHISADGDSICSSFALSLWLKSMGKNPVVVFEEAIEDRLTFLVPDDIEYYVVPNMPEGEFELAVSVDAATFERLGKRGELFRDAAENCKIDHHVIVDSFGKKNYENPNWSANCEGLWELFNNECFCFCDIEEVLRGRIAYYLYTGLLTDTGGFAYANTTENTLFVASKLIPYVKDNAELHFRLFDATTKEKVALKSRAFSKLEFALDGRVVFLEITDEDFEATDSVYDDANDFVSDMRTIEGVRVAAFARPNRNGSGIKVSMRSAGDIDVAEFTQSIGGGGHKNAAGADYAGSFEEVKEKIIKWME